MSIHPRYLHWRCLKGWVGHCQASRLSWDLEEATWLFRKFPMTVTCMPFLWSVNTTWASWSDMICCLVSTEFRTCLQILQSDSDHKDEQGAALYTKARMGLANLSVPMLSTRMSSDTSILTGQTSASLNCTTPATLDTVRPLLHTESCYSRTWTNHRKCRCWLGTKNCLGPNYCVLVFTFQSGVQSQETGKQRSEHVPNCEQEWAEQTNSSGWSRSSCLNATRPFS